MTYLIGVILVLLLIALVLVFRPPKPKSSKDAEIRETPADGTGETDELLDLEIESGAKKTVEAEEELDLVFDETAETVSDEREEQAAAESVEELDLDLVEEKDNDEFDEDIPFIDEDQEKFERKKGMDMAPALADVPDGHALIEEDETPEELAERLEYFLGTGEDESEPAVEEHVAEHDDHAFVIEEEAETEGETVEAGEVVEPTAESSRDSYSAGLGEQVERLRGEMNAAIANRETGELGRLEAALENLCAQQADIRSSFLQQKKLVDELEAAMSELREILPGFQLETVQTNLRQGRYEVVRSLVRDAASRLENSPQLAARILYQWGRLEEEYGEYAAAETMFSSACEADKENMSCLYAAGRMARILGNEEQALTMLKKRVDTGQQRGEESVELARSEHELARALVMAEQKDRVEQLLQSAGKTMEKLIGAGHPDLGPVLHDQAVLYDSSGRYEEAEPLYRKAMEVTEKGLGMDHPRLGTTLNKLAGLYEEIEMEQKSEPLYTRALEIKRKVLGENHPDVGTIMGHLANLLKQQGKYDQAEPMFKQSLAIAETALGKDHPNLSVVLNNMAELYADMGNEEQAEHFQERAFALFGLPGMGDGFVEMSKDDDFDVDDDKDQTIAGS
ncbi:MAG TPA: tetratricopeptide repeat protein [Desulfobacteraceae bacterium]|nr:tetratricopeptide repeat protein [Desulfobacteraceae bacterium]